MGKWRSRIGLIYAWAVVLLSWVGVMILSWLLLTSCKTERRVETRTRVSVDSVNCVRYEEMSAWDVARVRIDTTAWRCVKRVVVYDTEKPVNATTGKAPVKMEIEVKETRENGVAEREEEHRVAWRDTTQEHRLNVDIIEEKKKETKVDGKATWEVWMLCFWMGLLIGITLVSRTNIIKVIKQWLTRIFF